MRVILRETLNLLLMKSIITRDTFVGYNVVLTFDEKTLVPSNTFSAEMIDHFKSDEKQIVQYGKIKNDGICIWSICTTEK